eukprot:680009_1
MMNANVNIKELLKTYHCTVDNIPKSKRTNYLVFGYIRQNEKRHRLLFPIDIRNMCESYVDMRIMTAFEKEVAREKTPTKIVMLGAGAVGKTALVTRIVCNEFRQGYDSSIEDDYCCVIEVDGIQTEVDILDTMGQEQFAALRYHWIRESNAFMIVYAVNAERTFKHIKDLINQIVRSKEGEMEDVSMVIVANKHDLPNHQHEVTYEMGKQMIQKWRNICIDGYNVSEAYAMLVREITKRTVQRIKRMLQENKQTVNNVCC